MSHQSIDHSKNLVWDALSVPEDLRKEIREAIQKLININFKGKVSSERMETITRYLPKEVSKNPLYIVAFTLIYEHTYIGKRKQLDIDIICN